MKKMATKFTAAVLAGALIGSLSMGTVFAEETGVTPMSDLEIGVVIYSVEDTLGKGSKMVLDMAAEALDVKLNYAVGSLDPDSQIADVENLISAGVDGIIILNLSDQMMPVICD